MTKKTILPVLAVMLVLLALNANAQIVNAQAEKSFRDSPTKIVYIEAF